MANGQNVCPQASLFITGNTTQNNSAVVFFNRDFTNLSQLTITKLYLLALLTLKTFDSSLDAHLLKSRLSNEGIMSFLFDENIMTLNPLYNIMVGGVKLKVSELDFERAQRILYEIEQTPLRDESNKILVCPACGSGNYYQGYKSMKGIGGILSAILAFVLTVLPLYFKSVYKCKDCGNEFQMNRP